MMKDIFEAPFVEEMKKMTANMYRLGWDERNGGNISYMLDEDEVAKYLDIENVIRTIPIGFEAKSLVGKIFIVTGTGNYFKNVEFDPETNLGIIRIAEDGTTAELLWGYKDGSKFTSELPAHLMSHMARLSVNPENRVVMHCHPTYTLAMNYIHELDE
ncbi:MAG: rhamnulose-1-phosphate aldolase, partial [Clostridia bacterium]|nr:rhamnulose-1-phosphate aldolase [Clostridia bacterium]